MKMKPNISQFFPKYHLQSKHQLKNIIILILIVILKIKMSNNLNKQNFHKTHNKQKYSLQQLINHKYHNLIIILLHYPTLFPINQVFNKIILILIQHQLILINIQYSIYRYLNIINLLNPTILREIRFRNIQTSHLQNHHH